MSNDTPDIKTLERRLHMAKKIISSLIRQRDEARGMYLNRIRLDFSEDEAKNAATELGWYKDNDALDRIAELDQEMGLL
jgi:hypothetical protein